MVTNSADYAVYGGFRAGQANFAAYKTLVNNAANWTIVLGGDQAGQIPNTTAFSITPVPEPETYAMMLAGLGLMGWVARRRKGT